MTVIQVNKREEPPDAIRSVMEAVKQGELDSSKNLSPNRRVIGSLRHVTTGVRIWRSGLRVSLILMSGSRRFPPRATIWSA